MTEVPIHAVHSGAARNTYLADHIPVWVSDCQGGTAAARELVRDLDTVDRVLPEVVCLSAVRRVLLVDHDRAGRDREDRNRSVGIGPFGDRARVVEDPESATVRTHHEVFLTWVDHHVVVVRRREVRHLRPVCARIRAGEDVVLGSDEERVRVVGVLYDDVDDAHVR